MRKRKGLGRGWRIAADLAVVLVTAGMIWAFFDYPMTAEQEFRYAQRCCWVGPAEIQILGDHHNTVGTCQDQVLIQTGKDFLEYWPRAAEGPTLFPLEPGEFAAVDVPEGTASARLEADVSCWYSILPGGGWDIQATGQGTPWSRRYQAEGELRKEGGVLFRIPVQGDTDTVDGFLEWSQFRYLSERDTYHQPDAVRGVNARLEAVFYDGNGGELGRAVLCTPERG